MSYRLDRVIYRLRNRGRLSEADVDEIFGEVRTALLEADVKVGVVRIRGKAAEESKALD